MKNLKILIVEDDLNDASFLANQLRNLGYITIDHAATGEEALSFLDKSQEPDLIFMDIFLRGEKNGIDAALDIYKKAKIPVIFTSASENLFMLENAKFIKNSSFLSKPFDIDTIKKSIQFLEDESIKQTPEYIEAERLRVLNNYEIIDTPREGNFDRITKLTATLLNVPVALVSIVDNDRIWFKSRYGFREKEIPKSPDLFASAFLKKGFHYISGHKSKVDLTDPLLAYSAGFEFYAVAPLVTSEGYSLGTLCVMDKKSREISEEERNTLNDLAAVVMDEMDMRLAARKAYRLQREFLSMAVHDLKNPLAAVLGFSDMVKKREDLKTIHEFNDNIKKAADNMLQIVEGLLKNTLMELEQVKLDRIPIYFSEIVESVMAGNRSQAERKKQQLQVHIEGDPIINADPVKLGEALDNLVSNAIKYSPPSTLIEINVKQRDGSAHFEVKDRGPGLTVEEKEKVFEKFSKLSARPTGGETSTGLGLSISKKLVEMHGGTIKAESEGKQMGSTFCVEVPMATQHEQKELKYLHERV